jgi:hypothetical protein
MALKVDPFTPNTPIDEPARFSGRENELKAIIDALFQTATILAISQLRERAESGRHPLSTWPPTWLKATASCSTD